MATADVEALLRSGGVSGYDYAQVVSFQERLRCAGVNPDEYKNVASLHPLLRSAGAESCSLIVGLDFTDSNEEPGKRAFHGLSLHALDSTYGANPYEKALSIIGNALAPMFDEDGLIPAYVFGDVETREEALRRLGHRTGCKGIEGTASVLAQHRKAMRVVKSRGNSFHVLLILAAGEVTGGDCLQKTAEAIVQASSTCPLSIVMVGLGDGPWEDMEIWDYIQNAQLDNLSFVRFSEFQSLETSCDCVREVAETAFAVRALRNLPEQFAAMRSFGLLGSAAAATLSDRGR